MVFLHERWQRMNDRPNIILVAMDATRTDRLSTYGYDRLTSPNIDRFAQDGVLFESAFAPSVWTLPVMASIFTGLPPHVHGTTWSRPILPANCLTLAEILSNAGYDTLGISPGAWIGPATGLARGFDSFIEIYRLIQRKPEWNVTKLLNRFFIKYVFNRTDKGAQRINTTVAHWLGSRRIEKVNKPFFLFLHYMEPHYPYRPPKPYISMDFTNRKDLRMARQIKHNPLDYFAGRLTLSQQDLRLLSQLYDSEIAYLDLQLGNLIRSLNQYDLLESSVVILFADHGENIGDHGLMDHHFCLYDTLIHVPLIIRYPPRFPRGLRLTQIVESRDIFSTALKLAGIDNVSLYHDNHSLLIDDIRQNPRRYAIAQCSGEFVNAIRKRKPRVDISHYGQRLTAIRTERYKYIESSTGATELYDLQSDSNEDHNIAQEEAVLCKQLQGVLHSDLRDGVDEQLQNGSNEVIDDPIVQERLRYLGYLD